MKAIVAYWVKPFEYEIGYDSRPKSIERVCTTVESLRQFLQEVHNSSTEKAHIQWSESLAGLCDPRLKTDSKFFGGDGFDYLNRCLAKNEGGVCFAHIIGKVGEYYYGFQVRNIY